MTQAPKHRAFFGDAERDFALTAPLIVELERKTGTGIYAFGSRVFSSQCSLNDVSETIRLGMIGGGTDPEEASALIAAYLTARPIFHAYALACEILTDLLTGAEPEGTEADDLDEGKSTNLADLEPTP